MIDFASLLWFAAYGVAFLTIGLVLRLVAGWSGGTSLADAFGGGYRDAPWPRGVQEEEPVRWNLAAIGPRSRRSHEDRAKGQPDPACPTPCHQPRQVARPLA